jgi:hypothetical protein
VVSVSLAVKVMGLSTRCPRVQLSASTSSLQHSPGVGARVRYIWYHAVFESKADPEMLMEVGARLTEIPSRAQAAT